MGVKDRNRRLTRIRRATLTISIFSTLLAGIWRLIFSAMSVTREDEWILWGISTADGSVLWNPKVSFLGISLTLLSVVVCISMYARYVRLRRGKEGTSVPYYLLLGFLVVSVYFSVVMQMFTMFGAVKTVVEVVLLTLTLIVLLWSRNNKEVGANGGSGGSGSGVYR